MNVSAFLSELRCREIEVRLEGERLRCSAPAGALTPPLQGQLRDHKKEIRQFLLMAQALQKQQEAIVPLQASGTRIPIFAVPGHNGDVFTYRALAQHLGSSQPFFGLQPPGVTGSSRPLVRVEDLAQYFARQINTYRPHGPCIIAGFCAGGTVAFELARELLRCGTPVSFLALFGCPYPTFFRFPALMANGLAHHVRSVRKHFRNLAPQSWAERRWYIAAELRRRNGQRGARRLAAGAEVERVLKLRSRLERVTLRAVRRYTPAYLSGRVCLILPSGEWARAGFGSLCWRSVAERSEDYFGPDGCRGENMLQQPDVKAFAEIFIRCRDHVEMQAVPGGRNNYDHDRLSSAHSQEMNAEVAGA